MLQVRGGAAYAASMSLRTSLVAFGVVGFVAFLAHTTAATQCPAREGACAKVHALMRGRPAAARIAAAATVVTPMTSRTFDGPALVQIASAQR